MQKDFVKTPDENKRNLGKDADRILLIAIIEFSDLDIVRKVKIRMADLPARSETSHKTMDLKRDFNMSASNHGNIDCNEHNIAAHSHDLKFIILKKLYQDSLREMEGKNKSDLDSPNDPAISALNDKTSIVEIYDPKTNHFVRVDSVRTDSSSTSLGFFGKRIRCRITNCPIPNYAKTEQLKTFPMIKGRFFPFSSSGIRYAGKTLRISEKLNSGEIRTGLNVWDGSLLLARYLEIHPQKIKSKRVLELGAGCGLVGIAAAYLFAHQVTLTDLEYALPLMQHNVNQNSSHIPKGTSVECRVCDWNTATWADTFTGQENFDVILVADCVWVKTLVQPLLRILNELMQHSDKETKLIISYQRRGKDTHDLFYNALFQSFHVCEVDVGSSVEDRILPDIFYVFECQKKL